MNGPDTEKNLVKDASQPVKKNRKVIAICLSIFIISVCIAIIAVHLLWPLIMEVKPEIVGKINLPRMRSYKVPISNETLYVTHSIDVQWSPQGVNTYTKLTEI